MSVLSRTERHGDVERFQVAYALAGKPLYWTSIYRAGDVLIDSGCARCRRDIAHYLEHHPVRAALTTHEHEDHVGNHSILGDDVEIHAPRRAVDLLESGPPRLPAYRWIVWGAHEKRPGVHTLGEKVAVGADHQAFRVIATPGHSSDHVVFLDESRSAVFSGDAFLGKLRAVRAKENVAEQMRSLRAIADLDPAVLFPTHGAVMRRPRIRLLEVADHFDRIGDLARRLHEDGWSTKRIRQSLMGREPPIYWWSNGAFSAENIVKSLVRDTL